MKCPNNQELGSRQAGATMIEVLVTVVIVSFGLLGIAALQMIAVRNSQQALQESLATMYSYSILDSMRANRPAALAGAYNAANRCTAPTGTTLADKDWSFWLAGVHSQLGTTACADVDCTTAGSCTTTIKWTDAREKASTSSITTKAQL